MAGEERTLSILVKAKNLASGVFKQVSKDAGSMASRIGSEVRRGVGNAVKNIQMVGIAAVGAIGLAVRGGLESLATLEDAMSSVDGAIEATNNKGKITAGQIATWANEIESSVDAAFDDKDITAATATLIRYGKLAPGAVRPAMQVMTDLATKTGSVESAATLMAKALADPANAAGKLARAGVILTDEQKKQIKAMVEAGDVAGAQSLLLDELAKATQGAADASAGPYRDAINTLKDTWEDLSRALAVGFLPVIQEVSEYLKGKMADPSFLDKVRGFGEKLAGFLREAFEAAKKIPWQQIGDAMKLAGEGAKAAYDLFMGLPDWVKTAVLTGWGLNKLTGGALGGIVGELAKGLIKGVLGITAAVVNINAGTVNGMPGGLPGGGKGGPGGLLPMLGPITAGVIAAIGIDQFNQGQAQNISGIHVGSQAEADFFKNSLVGQALKVLPPDLVRALGGATGGPGGQAFWGEVLRINEEALTYQQQTATNTGSDALGQLASHVASERLDNAAVSFGDAVGDKFSASLVPVIGAMDRNENGILRVREIMASKLGLTVAELMGLKRASGGWNAELAGKLGISNQKLQSMVGESREIRGEVTDAEAAIRGVKTAIQNKDLSVTVNVNTKTTLNGRIIANEHYRESRNSGNRGGPIVF